MSFRGQDEQGRAFRANWKRLTASVEGGEKTLAIGQHILREDDVNWRELGWIWCEGKNEATSQRRCALSIGRHYRPAMSVRVAITAPKMPSSHQVLTTFHSAIGSSLAAHDPVGH